MTTREPAHEEQPSQPLVRVVDENTPLITQENLPTATRKETYQHHGTIRSFFIIFDLTCITIASSATTGLLTVGLPEITSNLALPENLLLWPLSVYYLASGSCFLIAGTIADLTDPKMVNVLGTFILAFSILASGWALNGYWLIGARTAQGIAVAMTIPTSVAIVTSSFPPGRVRNLGFSSLGLANPLGFSFGLVFGGLLQETPIGWRLGFYLCGAGTLVLALSNSFLVPSCSTGSQMPLYDVLKAVDWVGVLISAISLACLSYSFAVLADGIERIKTPNNIAILCIAVILFPAFFMWMDRQKRNGKSALIPNGLWGKLPFLTISIIVLLQWAVIQSMEVYFSLFFQNVQSLSPIQASLQFLPGIIIGVLLNISTGLFVHHIRIDILVTVVSIIATASPLFMALTEPAWPYWYTAFWSVLLSPVSVDVVFTIAHLIVVDVFPPKMHALAGAVFNVVAQLGASIGLAAMAIISSAYSKDSSNAGNHTPDVLLYEYRVVFWVCFGLMGFSCLVAPLGLRTIGRLGSAASSHSPS